MLFFLIALLTVLLVLDCLLLILLVLIQLPKKEAGAGLAFGGAATDALFGSGTGNVLTKATKYGAVAFFVLLLVIGAMQAAYFHKSSRRFTTGVEAAAQKGESSMTQPTTPAPATAPGLVTPTNAPSVNVPPATVTNAVPAATNTPN